MKIVKDQNGSVPIMENTNKQSYISQSTKESSCILYARSAYDSFTLDLENFMSLWEKEKSFNYTDFAAIWQSTNFTYIFA